MNKYIISNWKANKNAQTAQAWLDELAKTIVSISEEVEVVVAPSFPLLPVFLDIDADYPLLAKMNLAVQDISPFAAGSYTGAVATENLAGFNVSYAIVGHSERRQYFHESHQDVANKVSRCLEAGITPILCVDDEYIADQAAALGKEQLSHCIVAYEELSAIGTGKNASIAHVQSVIDRIKVVFGDIPVLYGGSVTAQNAAEYVAICDGVLVGGASLEAKSFSSIITAIGLDLTT